MKKKENTNVAIIIPTYNAAASIVTTLHQILAVMPNCRIYVVDDNSPDKTGEIVLKNFKDTKQVILLTRKQKDGRGSAVIYGLRAALKVIANEYFIEMDADLCHKPEYIPQLVKKCMSADVVIASRYLPDSKIYNWNMKRRIMSYSINTFSKLVLRIPITDYTDGFRCYSRKAVQLLADKSFMAKGYIVLSEIAYLCYKDNMKFAEVPISFYFEPVTKSNLNIKEIKEALLTIIKLRFNYGR